MGHLVIFATCILERKMIEFKHIAEKLSSKEKRNI
jgi:hypothetical protein